MLESIFANMPRLLGFLLVLSSIRIVLADDQWRQPRLACSADGTLIIEPARDQNITIRLSHSSQLWVNDSNVLEKLERRVHRQKLTGQETPPTIESFTEQVQNAKGELRRLNIRFNSFFNRSSRALAPAVIRRDLARIRRIEAQLDIIQAMMNLDECKSNPCQNGGTCFDAYKGFHCECLKGWRGQTCSEDVDECYMFAGTELGCQNNAVCLNTPGSYNCTCRNGYKGIHCRLRDAVCENSPAAELCDHGVCVHASNEKGYTCICDSGWMVNNATSACDIDVNECAETTNPCYGECINLPGSFKCGACPNGYTGNGFICVDINECEQENGGCSLKPRVSCINTEGSFRCGDCPWNWIGDGRECRPGPKSCDQENICYPNARCEYISGRATCTCPPGMHGHGFGPHGCTGTYMPNPCANHLCKNNGTCVVSGRGTRCICQYGYTGPNCEDQDACHPNPCQNEGACQLLPKNKYRCLCSLQTMGTNCEARRDFCGSIIRQESGEMRYPPSGNGYEVMERCAWIISTNTTNVLNVTFSEFDLEDSRDCTKDWLQIHDGLRLVSQILGRFCGKTLPMGGNLVSSQQALFFYFRSDGAQNGAGFKMSWISQPHSCGEVLDLKAGDSGIIRSPGYPGKTNSNRDCQWNLSGPFGFRFLFHFYEVNLGTQPNCTGDTLKMFDLDLKLKFICDSSKPGPLYSSSNKVLLALHTDKFGSDSSFQVHYEVIPNVPNCGGIFSEPKGIISGYMDAPACLYLIEQPKGLKIELEFTSLSSIVLNDCSLILLELFDGSSTEDKLIKRLCGVNSFGERFQSSGNTLLLSYKYSFVGVPQTLGFEAKYSRICGDKIFETESGIITTPNYPNPYNDHITCTYDIYGPIETVVYANFTDFSITESTPHGMDEKEPDAELLKDENMNYVDVYLSNTNKRRYYKGEPMLLISTRNHLRIVFHSEVNSRRARGLSVEYSFVRESCGGVMTKTSGSFRRHPFSAHNFCEWVLEAPEGKHISLTLRYYREIPSSKPDQKVLFIYANYTNTDAELLQSYNDETRRIEETYATNLLTIIWRKSETLQIGFHVIVAHYDFIDSESVCGGNHRTRVGVIKTPTWPKPYEPSLNCTWVISAPTAHKIELVVQNFTIEDLDNNCADDYLEIKNGMSSDSPLIGKYCGNKIPAFIQSFTNNLYLHFVSDELVNGPGFYITWRSTETGCGGTLNSHTGSIYSPHYPDIPDGPITCDWHIITSKGSKLSIELFSLEQTNRLCHKDLLSVYDGPNSASRNLNRQCNPRDIPLRYASTTNEALVRYTVTEDDCMQFKLVYYTDCNVVIDNWQGVIESPNFPEEYPPNLRCVWDIRGGRNNKISLAFSQLNVETKESVCSYDYIDVIDMRNDEILSEKRLCSMPFGHITSEGNRLQLKFVSDYASGASGFRAEYKQMGCGEHLRGETGIFRTPNAPYSIDMDCDWYIEVPAGLQIVLKVLDLHIESKTSDCSEDAFIVSETKNSSIYLQKTCKVERMPFTITSPANRLYVHFNSSAVRARKYFDASYTTKAASCGGTYGGNRGTIATPNFPDESITDIKCVWTILVDDSNSIVLQFTKMEITETTNCTRSYLEIRENEADGKVLKRTCGVNDFQRAINNNQVTVILVIAGGDSGKFEMEYSKKCGSIFTETSGFIRSNANDASCDWFIRPHLDNRANGTEEDFMISIDILHFDSICNNKNVSESNFMRAYPFSPMCEELYCSFAAIVFKDNFVVNLCEDHHKTFSYRANNVHISAYHSNFLAKYSVVQNSCGGTINSLRGSLSSPHYPSTYPSNVECLWSIESIRGYFIEVQFELLDLPKSEFCNDDYVELRTGLHGPLLGVYCGNELPMEPITTFEKFNVKFRSIENSTGNGFKLSWNYVHSNELNGTEGIIESPPLNVIHNDENPYSWRITVPREQHISLEFKEYNNGLILYDGFNEVALQVEIQDSPWRFVSSSSVVYLSTSNTELDEFRINWNVVNRTDVPNNDTSNCFEILQLSRTRSVNISSPGYPKNYENDIKCTWILNPASETDHATLLLFEAKLEDSFDCAADSLRVFTSSNLQDWEEVFKICQSRDMSFTPIKVFIGTPYLKLELVTDLSVTERGFTASGATECGANLTSPVGQIIGHNVASLINFQQECKWHITARPGKQLLLSFDFGSTKMLSEGETCKNYALLYDGLDNRAPLAAPGRICNRENNIVKTFESSTNHVLLVYKISDIVQFPARELWNVTYREVSHCNDEVQLTPFSRWVNISSPNYPYVPQPHTECTWTVVGPVGQTLQIEFIDRFDMNARHCNEEYVELYDGATLLAPKLGQYCRKPNIVRTTGNTLYVRYATDIAEPRSGFRANVSIGVCGGTYSSFKGEITSNNYPHLGAYPKYSVCNYTIKVPQNFRIVLTFQDLHLPYNASNLQGSDSIELFNVHDIDDGTDIPIIYGNWTEMPKFESETNEVVLRFRTYQGNNNYRGFKVNYERKFIPCFKDVNGELGFLTVGNPINSIFSSVCNWKIKVPKGQRVRLELLNVEVPLSENSTHTPVHRSQIPKITFYNDPEASSKITEMMLQNYNASEVIRSTDNFMYVRIQIGFGALRVRKLEARYSSDEESMCPNNIHGETGIINLNPSMKNISFYCAVGFELNGQETLSMNIRKLEVYRNNTFGRPYAVVIKVDSEMVPYKTFFTNVTDTLVSVSGKRGSIILRQNDIVKVDKFSANYVRHTCGGQINLEDGSTMEYPTQLPAYVLNGGLECVWTLKNSAHERLLKLFGNITLNGECDNEYLSFHGGSSLIYPEITRICRDNQANFTGIQLRNPSTLFVYHTDDYDPAKSNFNLNIEKSLVCGTVTKGTSTISNVVVDSRMYKNNFECSWEFWAASGFYLSLQFFERFFIEESKNCVKDHVEIQLYRNALWIPYARYCGRQRPETLSTSSQRMRAIFRTDNDTTGDGFSFKVMPTCFVTLNATTEMQSVQNPRLDDAPYTRMHCEYIIGTNTNHMINVRIREVSTYQRVYVREIRTKCDLAKFTVFKKDDTDKWSETNQFCLEGEVRAFNELKLVFDGFSTRWYVIDYKLNTCGGNITTPTDIHTLLHEIDSYRYADNMKCVWYVQAPADHSVVIQFKYFDFEDTLNCVYDYVAIYRGEIPGENRITRLCGKLTKNVPEIMVDGNRAIVEAVSDSSSSGRGFEAKIAFTRNCNERISLSDGNTPVTLSRHLNFNASAVMICNYDVTAPEGYRVVVNLKVLQLNNKSKCENFTTCNTCNYIEVVDSLEEDSVSMGKYCIRNASNTQLVSSFRDAIIKLRAAEEEQLSFEIELQMQRSTCGIQGELKLEEDKVIQIMQPEQGGNYAPTTHCTWRIDASSPFVLNFTRFDLQNASQVTEKCNDYVQIKTLLRTNIICGHQKEFIIQIPQMYATTVEITFHSDEEIEGKGFHLIARRYGVCNATYTQLSGLIDIYRPDSAALPCISEIRVPDDYKITVITRILEFTKYNCSEPNFKVTDTKTNETLFGRCHSLYSDHGIFTNSSSIRIYSNFVNHNQMNYLASGPNKTAGCGGVMNGLGGTIMSPPYINDRNYSNCRWEIEVPQPNKIRIMFIVFNMGTSINCDLDYVTITEMPVNGTIGATKRFCGPHTPDTYTTQTNRIVIVSRKSPNFDGTGWTISFQNDIFNSDDSDYV